MLVPMTSMLAVFVEATKSPLQSVPIGSSSVENRMAWITAFCEGVRTSGVGHDAGKWSATYTLGGTFRGKGAHPSIPNAHITITATKEAHR